MIKFTCFQQHDAVSMSCFAAPRSPPAPPSALCGTAERVSAVRAGGASRTFCGAREGARGRGAQGARVRGGLPGGFACTRARRAEERHTPARPRATARICARGRWGTPLLLMAARVRGTLCSRERRAGAA